MKTQQIQTACYYSACTLLDVTLFQHGMQRVKVQNSTLHYILMNSLISL